ncbi:MAG: copper-containing nitrite reductase [Acidobacteriota bacterium]
MTKMWRHKTKMVVIVLAWLIAMTPLLAACQGGAQNIGKQVTATPSPGSGEEFTVKTVSDNDGLGFVGVGGAIDGVRNPTLSAAEGTTVKVNLIDGDGSQHTISFPDFHATSQEVTKKDDQVSVTFTASKSGAFQYFCTLTGHKQAGMLGQLNVGTGTSQGATAEDVAHLPGDLPAPIGDREPQNIRVEMNIVEKEGQLDDGTTYTYWTFDGTVPGPFVRIREGDTVEVHLTNPPDATMTHSIDLHAVNGPGGGATVMQVAPGETKQFTFKALNPGLYVYHCATPSVAHHIAQGMYGMILVEPAGGLPPVDHEYYVMQGDVYTSQSFGTKGHLDFNAAGMMAEQPTYVVFNGEVGSLTTKHPLTAKVGETVRIYFGDGGPNLTSSFHVIGEIFDKVYPEGSLTSAPLTNVQTTTVAPGGATIVEFTVQVPGRYLLVDHALSRIEEGALGYLVVDGAANPDVFSAPEASATPAE